MKVFSTTEAGQMIGRPAWQVRLVSDTLKPPFARIGLQRAIPEDRIEELARACDAKYGKISEAASA